MHRQVMWTPVNWAGAEHVDVRSGAGGVTVDGVVVANDGWSGAAFVSDRV